MCVRNLFRKEEGVFSAFVIIFLVTLALMGLGAHILMRTEGENLSSQAQSMQAKYAADAAVYYAKEAIARDTLDTSKSFTLGASSLSVAPAYTNEVCTLTVSASLNDFDYNYQVALLRDAAVWTTGSVDALIRVCNPAGSIDENYCIEGSVKMANLNLTTLLTIATAQIPENSNHVVSGDFTAPDGFPNGSYWSNDGITPNITYITGNLNVPDNRTIWGIYVVLGQATIRNNSTLNGVLYLPTNGKDVFMRLYSQVVGGIICNGNVTYSGSGREAYVNYNYINMSGLKQYQTFPDSSWVSRITSWSLQ